MAYENDCISIPSNNQIFQYESDLGILKLKQTMNLNDFNENYDLLNDIISEHKKKVKSGEKFQTLLMPFFCFKIPLQILKDIGNFDSTFGIGGGEDVDYRIRSELKGYSVNYLTDSSHRKRLKSLNMENDTLFCLSPPINSDIIPILKGDKLVKL